MSSTTNELWICRLIVEKENEKQLNSLVYINKKHEQLRIQSIEDSGLTIRLKSIVGSLYSLPYIYRRVVPPKPKMRNHLSTEENEKIQISYRCLYDYCHLMMRMLDYVGKYPLSVLHHQTNRYWLCLACIAY